MAQIIKNGITFNSVKTAGVSMGQWPIYLLGQQGPDEDGGIINAVDIDWNGAEVGENIIINTTGELLNWIKNNASNINEERLAEIQNKVDIYQSVFNNVLTKTYGDTTYANKTATENSINELNTALSNVRSSISTVNGNLTELSNKTNQLERAHQYFITTSDAQTLINNRVEQIIGEAPEALDTLKEIADQLGNDENAVAALTTAVASKADAANVYDKESVDLLINGLSETIETQDIQIEALQTYNAVLLARIKKLEKAFSSLVPEEPEDESYNVIVPASDEPLTLEEIIASINTDAEKPDAIQALNMNQLSNPTDTYLVYPLSWEIVENDQIVSPVIKDWNGFEIGFSINEDTPTVMVDEIEYRVSDIKLGKGQYTIEFK